MRSPTKPRVRRGITPCSRDRFVTPVEQVHEGDLAAIDRLLEQSADLSRVFHHQADHGRVGRLDTGIGRRLEQILRHVQQVIDAILGLAQVAGRSLGPA